MKTLYSYDAGGIDYLREPADARFSFDDFRFTKRPDDASRVTMTAFAAEVTALRFTEADLDVVRIERSFAVMWSVYLIRGTVSLPQLFHRFGPPNAS